VLTCFIEGEHLDPANPPERIQTPEMQRVMSIVEQFSEKDRAYHTYQARQNYLRQQKSSARHIQVIEAEQMREPAEKERERAEKEQALVSEQRERTEKERERAEKEQALASEQREGDETERERAEKEAALAEIERLKVLLNDARSR
jgi:hypothetical protein